MLALFVSMVSLPVAIALYEHEKGNDHMTKQARLAACTLLPIALSSLLVFVSNINLEYLGTFFSFLKGKELVLDRWHNEDQGAKADILANITTHITRVIEEDMHIWVEENWENWKREKPAWMTDHIRSKIPLHYIPRIAGKIGLATSGRDSIVTVWNKFFGGFILYKDAITAIIL